MTPILDAIAPLILLTIFGTGLRLIGFLDPARRSALEAVVYFVLVPPLIIRALHGVEIDPEALLPMVAAVVGPILAVTALAFAMRAVAPATSPWLHGPGFPSTVMGLTRNNLFIVLAAGQALLGPQGAALTAIAALLYVPTVNIISVICCMRYGTAQTGDVRGTLRELASNPFILGCVAGLLLNVTGIGLPGPLDPAAKLLSDSALGLALVCVGAGLTVPAMRLAPLGLVLTSVLKLLAMPLLAFVVCRATAVPDTVAVAAILYHTGPTAPAAYVLAKQLGGDADYMAALVTIQTMAVAITLPLVFAAARAVYG